MAEENKGLVTPDADERDIEATSVDASDAGKADVETPDAGAPDDSIPDGDATDSDTPDDVPVAETPNAGELDVEAPDSDAPGADKADTDASDAGKADASDPDASVAGESDDDALDTDAPDSEIPDEKSPDDFDDLEARLKKLEKAERAVDDAYNTGRVERAKITQAAQLDAAEAVAMAGIAMEADIEADEAMRITVIAERSGDRKKAKAARKREREARKKAKAEHEAATKSARRAYEAIKFSAPNKMGFMRVVQVAFAVHIGTVLVYLMLTSRDTMSYDVSSMMDWIMVILEGVAFWMFINRYKIARPLVIAMAIFGIVVPTAFDLITGKFNVFAISLNTIFYLFLIFYFSLSRRVKATLVNDLSMRKGDYEEDDDFVVNRRGWPFVRNLIIYFILFSIIGHWMEMGMCQFIILGVVQGEYDPSNTMLWRDWLYPFPMEGAAVVVIALVLYPFYLWLKKRFKDRKWIAYVISFLAGALLCTIIEFSMGLIVNDHYQLWDYRDNFCNFMGQVCLQNTMAFGVVASVITWWVYPLMERWIARVPRDVMNIVFVVVAVFGAIVWSLYLINPPGVDDHNLPENKDNPELVQKGYDTRMVASKLSEVDDAVISLELAINATEQLDKEKLTKSAEKIRKDAKSMLVNDLGLQEYPDFYEKLLANARSNANANANANSTSSASSSSDSSASSSASSSATASSASSASSASAASSRSAASSTSAASADSDSSASSASSGS